MKYNNIMVVKVEPRRSSPPPASLPPRATVVMFPSPTVFHRLAFVQPPEAQCLAPYITQRRQREMTLQKSSVPTKATKRQASPPRRVSVRNRDAAVTEVKPAHVQPRRTRSANKRRQVAKRAFSVVHVAGKIQDQSVGACVKVQPSCAPAGTRKASRQAALRSVRR